MDNLKIVGAPLPDMPWEDRPEGSKEVLWRYSKNPVIPRDILPTSNSVFNSAVVPFKVCLCLRPPCMFYRGSLLCDLV